jgi:dTDP-4-dehydrorhamnose reductase
LIEANRTGLFHVTNTGDCTWYDLARFVFDREGIKADLTPIPTSAYPTAARRPAYSVLGTEALAASGVGRPRPWQEAVQAYLVERRTRKP